MNKGILIALSLAATGLTQGLAGGIDASATVHAMQTPVTREILPVFELGKSWHCQVVDGVDPDRILGHESWTVTDKVNIGGKEMWNVVHSDDFKGYTETLMFHESDGQIFVYFEEAEEMALLYDLNYCKGDMVYSGNHFVSDKDRIAVNGIDRNRIFIIEPENDWHSIWIEGIGAFGKACLTMFPVPGCDPDGPKSRFEKCCLNGETIFSNEDLEAESAGAPDITYAPVETSRFAPLFENGKSWVVEKLDSDSGLPVGNIKVEVEGTDIVNGFDCWRLIQTDTANGEHKDLYAFEDDGRVYFYYGPTGGFALMMDFGYEPYYFVSAYDWSVTDTDMAEVAGEKRKRLTIKRLRHDLVDIWVEGIGSADGAYISYITDRDLKYRVSECSLNGNVIFRYNDFSKPVESVDGISDDGSLSVSWTGGELVAVADGDVVVTIEVIGIDGAKRATASGRGQAAADLTQLAPGVYVVRASDGTSVKTSKAMIND